MKQTIGIRFSRYGQVLACLHDPGDDAPLAVGDSAMVMTERGLNCGQVVWQRPWQEDMERVLKAANVAVESMSSQSADDGQEEADSAPMPSARRATEEERMAAQDNAVLSREAYQFCRRCIADRRLDMKLVDVEILFDRSKMVFFFTAPTRIDFRDLVKDLVRQYRTRIELRQIGVRHETQMLGALGNCGMVCCCRRYLHKFAPVTIKMAKEQNLSLNPTKISGVCGRLMCCLKHEQETYEELNSRLPGNGDYVTTADGLKGEVQSVNVLRQKVKVVVTLEGDEKEIREYPVEELKFRPRRKKEKGGVSDKELKKLEALEKQERKSKLDDD